MYQLIFQTVNESCVAARLKGKQKKSSGKSWVGEGWNGGGGAGLGEGGGSGEAQLKSHQRSSSSSVHYLGNHQHGSPWADQNNRLPLSKMFWTWDCHRYKPLSRQAKWFLPNSKYMNMKCSDLSILIIQGDFFNWASPEFAKCWPVS